jgi:signal transduction histidine kinase
LIGFSKVTRDATTRRTAEAALEETRRKLDQAQRLEVLGRLTGNVAHDFRNLLASVSSGMKLIARSDDRRVLDKVVPEVNHALDRGLDLISQLLNFARPARSTPQAIDFGALLRATRGILERTLGPGVELRVDVQSGLWTINIDPTRMEMVILNLAINARDAMPDGGIVEIVARNVPGGDDGRDWVLISVHDTGLGMSPDVLAKALEPFFTTKEAGRGTGLGLSQVQAFADEAGGSVELKSEPEKGTIVSIRLPRA